MKALARWVFYWLPVFVWMGLIFFLSSFHKIQATEVGWANFATRKLAHLSEYTVLYFLFYRALFQTLKANLARALFLSFVLTFFYALTDEYHQTFISGRTGKVFDVLVDSLGAFLGLFFCWKLILFIPEKVRKAIL